MKREDMKRELRIASPCSADWNRMVGDERVRHCAECNLDVYNFSAMAREEVERIVAEREGRLCARFYQRPDGTMLTQNCPVGFRALVRRASRVAGAALTAVMSAAPAMAGAILPKSPFLLQIQAAQAGLALDVVDPSGAVVAKAPVTVVNEKTGVKIDAVTDANGQLRLVDLPAGSYEVAVRAAGFMTRTVEHVSVPTASSLKLQLNLGLMGEVIEIPAQKTRPARRLGSRIRRIL